MPDTLADLVRKRYPGKYDDMDDDTLENSVVKKHPGKYEDLMPPRRNSPPAALAVDNPDVDARIKSAKDFLNQRSVPEEGLPDYGKREDGGQKASGFLGPKKVPGTDSIASEYSIADSEKLKDAKGNYQNYPTLVPGLTKEELDHTMNAIATHGPLLDSVKQKAEAHALKRRSEGKSFFAEAGSTDEKVDPSTLPYSIKDLDESKPSAFKKQYETVGPPLPQAKNEQTPTAAPPSNHSAILDFADSVSRFLNNHPRVQEALTGTSPEFEAMKKSYGITDVKGPGFMRIPGLSEENVNKAAQAVTGESGYLRLGAGAITKALGDMAAVAFDPRATVPERTPSPPHNTFDVPYTVHPDEPPPASGNTFQPTSPVPVRQPPIESRFQPPEAAESRFPSVEQPPTIDAAVTPRTPRSTEIPYRMEPQATSEEGLPVRQQTQQTVTEAPIQRFMRENPAASMSDIEKFIRSMSATQSAQQGIQPQPQQDLPVRAEDPFTAGATENRTDILPQPGGPEFAPTDAIAAPEEKPQPKTDPEENIYTQAINKFNMGKPLPTAPKVQASDLRPDAPYVPVSPFKTVEPQAAVEAPPESALPAKQEQPTATHIGNQPGYADVPETPLYNIEGGPEHGFTVTAQGLKDRGIPVPPIDKSKQGKTGAQLREEALAAKAKKPEVMPEVSEPWLHDVPRLKSAEQRAFTTPSAFRGQTEAARENNLLAAIENESVMDYHNRTGASIADSEIATGNAPEDNEVEKSKNPELVSEGAPRTMADHALAAADDMERRGDIEGANAQRESIARMLKAQGHEAWSNEIDLEAKKPQQEIVEHGSPEKFHPQLSGLKNYGDGVLYLDFDKEPKQLRSGDVEALLPEGSQVTELHTNEHLPSRFRVDIKGLDPIQSADIADQIERSIGGSFDSIVEMHGGPGGGKKKPSPFKGPSGAALDRLFSILEEVKNTHGEQAEINRTERASRFKNFEKTKGSGIDWAAKAFSKMKGEHEKADYFSEEQLSKKDIDSLFDGIKNGKVTSAEKVRAVSGMFKLLNGDIPDRSEVSALDDIFGGGFEDKIVQMHGGIGGFGPIRVKLAETANTMKAMKSMLDVSAALRQGAGLAITPGFSKNGIQFINPAYRDAFQMMFKFFYDKKAYNAAMQAIIDDPDYIGARRAGLFLAKPGNLIKAEEAFGKNLIGYLKPIPGLNVVPIAEEASERAYTGFLNMLRFQTYKNLIKNAKDAGHVMEKTKQLRDKKGDFKLDEDGNVKTTSEPTKIAKDIAYYINVTTGRGSLGKLEKIVPELNVVLWSPRNVSSRLTMLNPMYYKGLSNFARFEAMKSLFSIAAIATTLLALAKLRGAKISGNILSADFGKARMPGSARPNASQIVVDPYTGLQQVVVAAARLTAESHRMVTGGKRAYNQENLLGIAGNFLANKESPIASFAHDLATAQSINFNDRSYVNKYGQKKNINPEIVNTIMPMIIQDATDVFKSDAKFADQVGLDAVSLLGVGVQNYPETKPQTSKFRKMSIPNR